MKQFCIILIYLSVFNVVTIGQNTTYFDSKGNVLESKEKADYYKVENEEGDNIKNVSEFYISGNKKATYSLNNRLVQNKPRWVINGEYLEWYPNGVLHKKIDYLNGRINSSLITYWPNGQLKRTEKYDESGRCTTKCFNEQGKKIEIYPYQIEAKFPGGRDSILSFNKRTIKKEYMTDTIIKTVRVGFHVEKDGTLSDIHIIKSQNPTLNQEALRVISAMPKWIPASEDGEYISKMATQDIFFGTYTGNMPYSFVEKMPVFMDGEESLSRYLNSELKYPKVALNNKIEGIVIVRFIIEKNGDVTKPVVIKGIGGGCDEEAIRVISKMPKWKPGTQGGKAVSVWFTLPIRFKLQ